MRFLATFSVCLMALPALSAQEQKTKPPSPQDAFQRAGAAAKKKDWRALAGHTSRESQTILAGGLVVFAGVIGEGIGVPATEEQKKAIKTLLAQHSVKADNIKGLLEKLQMNGPDTKKLALFLKEMGQRIQNKPEWIAGFARILETMEIGGMVMEGMATLSGSTLNNVQIEGKTARATLVTPDGVNRGETVFFVMEDGVWKIDLMRILQEKGP